MFKTPFKPIGHYVFNYKPRYYNEKKERLQALEEKYHKEESNEDSEYSVTLKKNNLKNDWSRTRTSSVDARSNYRLALIIAILTGCVLYILR